MKTIEIKKDQIIDIDTDTTINIKANAKILLNVSKGVELITNIDRDINATRILKLADVDANLKDTLNLEQGATLNNYMVVVGSSKGNIDIEGHLKKNNSSVKHYIVNMATKKANYKWSIKATNDAKETFYDITKYALCADQAKVDVVCNATMKKGCNGSSNEQILKAIMLSDDTDVRVDPLLIIDEPDLEGAGHGATVGKVDEEQIYYLRSRGISEIDAKLLIVSGYFNPILDLIQDEKFKKIF